MDLRTKFRTIAVPVLATVALLWALRSFAAPVSISVGATFNGNLSVTGAVSKGSGSFVIDDPIDPANKILYHSFVESPDAKNIYSGTAILNENGEVRVSLPAYFEELNGDYRYEFTPIGQPAPNLYIKQEVQNNTFVIAGGPPGAQVSWQVTGVRHDPWILAHPIIPEVEKGPGQLVNKGEYLFPGANSSQTP